MSKPPLCICRRTPGCCITTWLSLAQIRAFFVPQILYLAGQGLVTPFHCSQAVALLEPSKKNSVDHHHHHHHRRRRRCHFHQKKKKIKTTPKWTGSKNIKHNLMYICNNYSFIFRLKQAPFNARLLSYKTWDESHFLDLEIFILHGYHA